MPSRPIWLGKKTNHGKDTRAADSVSVEMKSALEKVAQNDRRFPPCETLGLRIKLCRLGAS
jgi:hypothetical protein